MSSFPPQYCRVVASQAVGNAAYVVLDTGPAGRPYFYGVACERRVDGWHEGSSGNGGGWTLADEETGLGTWTLWDDAPAGADRVRVEFRGQTTEHAIEGGFYFVAWFNELFTVEPAVIAMRIDGKWVEVTALDASPFIRKLDRDRRPGSSS